MFEDNVMRVQYVPLMRSEVSFNGQTEALDEELSKEVQVGTNGVQVTNCSFRQLMLFIE